MVEEFCHDESSPFAEEASVGVSTEKKNKSGTQVPRLKLLFLSFYNLDYGIGASASFIDQLMDLPPYAEAVVIEPNRIDLPRVRVELPDTVRRVKIPLPLIGLLSPLYPFLAFCYALKVSAGYRPHIVFSMHHPFHILSVVGHIVSRILRVPHVVDIRDVWRPMGLRITLSSRVSDIVERETARVIRNDFLVFVCSENERILKSRARTEFRRAIVLPNCVSRTLMKSIVARRLKKQKSIRFIYVGRLAPEYGLDKAWRLIDSLGSCGYESSLLVVGHKQTDDLPRYATYVGSLPRKETLQLIAESDVGIGPMNPTIAVPRKVVEYIALGKVAIVGKGAVSEDFIREYGDRILEVSEFDEANQVIERITAMLEEKGPLHRERIERLYCRRRIGVILNEVLCGARL